MIEVEVAELSRDRLRIGGTAVAYEGTLRLSVDDSDGECVVTTFVTADAGGPDRGRWTATIPVPADGYRLRIGQEEMEDEGAATSPGRTIQILLSSLARDDGG